MGVNPFTARRGSGVPEEPITGRQRDYLTDLLMQKAAIKGMDHESASALTVEFCEKLSKKTASDMITRAKEDNARLKTLFQPLKDDAVKAVTVAWVLDDGMYVRSDGAIFKLYHTVHGANVLVAKQLVLTHKYEENDDGSQGPRILGESTGEFIYKGTAPLASIAKDGRRMTLEEARSFGAIYGQCCRCLAPLTHEISIALGIGPKCGGHEYGDEFKVLYKTEQARLKQPA